MQVRMEVGRWRFNTEDPLLAIGQVPLNADLCWASRNSACEAGTYRVAVVGGTQWVPAGPVMLCAGGRLLC